MRILKTPKYIVTPVTPEIVKAALDECLIDYNPPCSGSNVPYRVDLSLMLRRVSNAINLALRQGKSKDERCLDCNGKLQVVRPGKFQCKNCG